MKDGCLAHLVYDAGAIDVRKQSIREPRPAQANVLPLVAYVGRERERARAQHDVDPAPGRQVQLVDVLGSDDEQVVFGDRRDALQQFEDAADEQEDGRADDADGRESLLDSMIGVLSGHDGSLSLDGSGVMSGDLIVIVVATVCGPHHPLWVIA